MIEIVGTDMVMKSFTQVNLHISDTNRPDGDDFILFTIQTGQFGIINDIGIVGEFTGAVNSVEVAIVGDNDLVTATQPGDFV